MSNLPKLTESVDIIQGLTDRPNALDGLDPAQLKAKFDEAANIIKLYINNVLIPEIESIDSSIVTKTDLTNARKLSPSGNFTGSWFGITDPTFADPGIANVVAQHTTQLEDKATKPRTLESIITKMRLGESVNIIAYGDSTTCGWDTKDNTGKTINTANGYNSYLTNKIGENWDAVAVNAYTARLQSLLRDIHKNNNIHVHNAGFGGVMMADGWAYNNFDNAALNNTHYGTPDVVIISFGLNESRSSKFDAAAYEGEYRKVIEKCFKKNIVPIIMTTDAISMINGSAISSNDIDSKNARTYDTIAKDLSKLYSIPFIDMNLYMRDWLNNNYDNFRVRDVIPDNIHVNDDGHNYKAGVIATHFSRDIIIYDGQEKDIILEDVRLNGNPSHSSVPFFNWTNPYPFHKTNRNFWTETLLAGVKLLEAWIFVDNTQPVLGFNVLDNAIARPKIKIYHNADITPYYDKTYSLNSQQAYVYDQACTKLHYGLNKIVIVPDADGGKFQINYMWLKNWASKALPPAPLYSTTNWSDAGNVEVKSPKSNAVHAKAATRTIKYSIPPKDKDNFAQLEVGGKLEINVRCRLHYGGIVIFPAETFNGDGKSRYLCVYSYISGGSTVNYALHYPHLGSSKQGVVDSGGVVGEVVSLCIDMERTSIDTINVKVYKNNRGATPLINFDVTGCYNFSGIVNGVIAANEANQHAYAEIISMSFNYL